jgi:hypothetical protein
VAHIDDLIQRRPEQVLLPLVARLRHGLSPSHHHPLRESRSAQNRNPKSQESHAKIPLSCKIHYSTSRRDRQYAGFGAKRRQTLTAQVTALHRSHRPVSHRSPEPTPINLPVDFAGPIKPAQKALRQVTPAHERGSSPEGVDQTWHCFPITGRTEKRLKAETQQHVRIHSDLALDGSGPSWHLGDIYLERRLKSQDPTPLSLTFVLFYLRSHLRNGSAGDGNGACRNMKMLPAIAAEPAMYTDRNG